MRRYRARTVRDATEVKARLLSHNNGPVWEIGGEIVAGVRADSIRNPARAISIHGRRSSGRSTTTRARAIGQAWPRGKLSWNADYVLTVARDDKTTDVDGWVRCRRQRRVLQTPISSSLPEISIASRRPSASCRNGHAAKRWAAAGDVTGGVSDYPVFSLARATINNETKQVRMLGATGFGAKRYVVEGQAFTTTARSVRARPSNVVQVFAVQERREGGPRLPMPSGTGCACIRLLEGGVRFVGEDRIDHTPKVGRRSTSRSATPSTSSASASRPTSEDRRQHLRGRAKITVRNHRATLSVESATNRSAGPGAWCSPPTMAKTSAGRQFAVPARGPQRW